LALEQLLLLQLLSISTGNTGVFGIESVTATTAHEPELRFILDFGVALPLEILPISAMWAEF